MMAHRPVATCLFAILGPIILAPVARATDCAPIDHLMDETAPSGPLFLPSYPTATQPALQVTAFVYDNAVAAIALIACEQPDRAERIVDALRIAATHDRYWHDGRLRNAYRAGPVTDGVPPALPGWWSPQASRWEEDAYQVGTATGNVAWAALAMLALDNARDNRPARQAAKRLMRWTAITVATDGPIPGFAGGFIGEEPAPERLLWESTEQNTDAAAAFALIAASDQSFAAAAHRARSFVAAMWDLRAGRFWLGTDATGNEINRNGSAIDAQLWPLIAITDPPADWLRAKDWVRVHHAIRGGYGFRDAPDGIWVEGTAQAALILPDLAALRVANAARAADGLLYATPSASVATGLALTPQSTSDDFRYFHLPHLGATAWAIIATAGYNPFVLK